jgi:hypothetical protein
LLEPGFERAKFRIVSEFGHQFGDGVHRRLDDGLGGVIVQTGFAGDAIDEA